MSHNDFTNGIVHLMRGDSFSMPIKVNVGTKLQPEYYSLGENDSLHFALCEPHQAFEDAVITKEFTKDSKKDSNGHIILELESEETKDLLVGKYYYQIKLNTKTSDDKIKVKTIVLPTQFFIDGNNVCEEEDS